MGGFFSYDTVPGKETPQRADAEMMSFFSQLRLDFDQRQVILLVDQGANTRGLRLDLA
jgi:hypothetical protein